MQSHQLSHPPGRAHGVRYARAIQVDHDDLGLVTALSD
jgi:hypothetical protein